MAGAFLLECFEANSPKSQKQPLSDNHKSAGLHHDERIHCAIPACFRQAGDVLAGMG